MRSKPDLFRQSNTISSEFLKTFCPIMCFCSWNWWQDTCFLRTREFEYSSRNAKIFMSAKDHLLWSLFVMRIWRIMF